MSRNPSRRMEVVALVRDPTLKAELNAILRVYENDNCSARDMQPDGSHVRRHPEPGEV
jgi:polyphosphate kinase